MSISRFAVAAALALGLSPALSAQTPPPPADALAITAPTRAPGNRGVETIQAEICSLCHGKNWEGGRAPSMLDEIWTVGGDDASLARSIREGFPAAGMPPFAGVLTSEEIRGLVILIREARAQQTGPLVRKSPDNVVIASELQRFKIERYAEGFVTPWGMAFLPDGRLLVTERPGRLRVVETNGQVGEPITGLPTTWQHQDGGLFDVAVHPDYTRNGWIYLSYSQEGEIPKTSSTRLSRGRIRDGAWVDQEAVFQAPPEFVWKSDIHYGSRFLFARDGHLFFSIGDRGRMIEAQNTGNPAGKIHRIYDDGRAPADNPFANQAGSFKSVWSYGHRNPQGLAQDPVTGEIWESEHGPRGGDELNLITPAHNYGWPVITYGMNDNGSPITDLTAKDGMDQPVAYWTPSPAVAGMDFYTGDKFPAWKNQLFLAALRGEALRRIEIKGHQVVHQEILFSGLGRVRDVQTGPDGYLYILINVEFINSPGMVYRLVPTTEAATAPVVPADAPVSVTKKPDE